MSDEIREQLSALVDDELDEVERPLLLGRLQRDAGLRDCLGRYQLIGEVLRGGAASTATLGVADSVRRALQDEDSPRAAPRRRPGWLKPVAGFAVAASVALVAVLSVTSLRDAGDDTVQQLASNAGLSAVTRVQDGQWDRIETGIDRRLAGYLVNHNEYAANRGMQAVMPYVRIVGYENQR